jgi:hypothetical protein
MIHPGQFRSEVIEPACQLCAGVGIPNTPYVRDLLMATAAQETLLGTWLRQIRGPALGVFEIEPASYATLMRRCNDRQLSLLVELGDEGSLTYNLLYSAVVCRIFYWQVPERLPVLTTKQTLWDYYKAHYNTLAGAATYSEFLHALSITDIKFASDQ